MTLSDSGGQSFQRLYDLTASVCKIQKKSIKNYLESFKKLFSKHFKKIFPNSYSLFQDCIDCVCNQKTAFLILLLKHLLPSDLSDGLENIIR
jgi:hypothetical protein